MYSLDYQRDTQQNSYSLTKPGVRVQHYSCQKQYSCYAKQEIGKHVKDLFQSVQKRLQQDQGYNPKHSVNTLEKEATNNTEEPVKLLRVGETGYESKTEL
jgi:hypothetical protein